MESHRTGFPPLPLLLEIPSGFPHYHRVDDGENSMRKSFALDLRESSLSLPREIQSMRMTEREKQGNSVLPRAI
jgi:hypothetical protein